MDQSSQPNTAHFNDGSAARLDTVLKRFRLTPELLWQNKRKRARTRTPSERRAPRALFHTIRHRVTPEPDHAREKTTTSSARLNTQLLLPCQGLSPRQEIAQHSGYRGCMVAHHRAGTPSRCEKRSGSPRDSILSHRQQHNIANRGLTPGRTGGGDTKPRRSSSPPGFFPGWATLLRQSLRIP
jgi:hypothetical protein